jgi:glutamine amidotransferase
MGWNRLRVQSPSALLEALSESDYFYFAHTFAAVNAFDGTVATCEHGAPFTAVFERGRLFATQFHPEKSGAAGARLLHNFLRLAA